MKKKIVIIITLLAILTITLAYLIVSRLASPVTVYVDPDMIGRAMGQDFSINVTVSSVVDLYGWSFKLRWNSTILEVVDVTEGTFLRNGGSTFFDPKINNTAGHIIVVATLIPNMPGSEIPGVSGNGTLVTIQFHVKEDGACDLILYGTLLANSAEQSITHIVFNGHFNSTS
jgi:hypothetical protein